MKWRFDWNYSSVPNSAFLMNITGNCWIIFCLLYHNLSFSSLPCKIDHQKNLRLRHLWILDGSKIIIKSRFYVQIMLGNCLVYLYRTFLQHMLRLVSQGTLTLFSAVLWNMRSKITQNTILTKISHCFGVTTIQRVLTLSDFLVRLAAGSFLKH